MILIYQTDRHWYNSVKPDQTGPERSDQDLQFAILSNLLDALFYGKTTFFKF